MPDDITPLQLRACLKGDTLLSAAEAEFVLPGRTKVVAEWLSLQPPCGRIGGEPVYRWQALVDAISSEEVGVERVGVADAARLLGLSRDSLDAAIREAPPDLPHAPFAVGAGRSRRHWRFEPSGLPKWWAAYRGWKAEQRSAPRPARGRAASAAGVEGGPVDWRRAASEFK